MRWRAAAESSWTITPGTRWSGVVCPFADLRHALEHAESCRAQPNGRWRVVGRDPDGDVLWAIVELHADLLVITVYRGDE